MSLFQARQRLQSELRNLNADLDTLRDQLEEEQEARSDLQRQLSRANAEAQEWRSKYESEGLARAEELEDAKRKLQAKLADAEQDAEAANIKVRCL